MPGPRQRQRWRRAPRSGSCQKAVREQRGHPGPWRGVAGGASGGPKDCDPGPSPAFRPQHEVWRFRTSSGMGGECPCTCLRLNVSTLWRVGS